MSLSRGARTALVLAALIAVAPAANASPDWCGDFGYRSHESVDSVTQIRVTYGSPVGEVKGVLFMTSATGTNPGVLFMHEGDGIEAGDLERCRELARMGYVVLAPEYAVRPGSIGQTTVAAGAVDQTLAGAEMLSAHPNVMDNRIGAVGSSHGAYVAMLAAGEDRKQFRCLIVANSAIDVPTIAPLVKTPILLQHGDKDNVVLMKSARHLNYEIKKNGGHAELKEYTLLPHGFWYIDGSAGRTTEVVAQADWAWDDATQFLDRKLNRGRPPVASK